MTSYPLYDLVSRGSNECWGDYANGKGWGPAYEKSCIHSGVIRTSGDLPTTWYNYTLASAGTIIDEDTSSSNPATNTTKDTESICPKGWTLPDNEQIKFNSSVASFSLVLGGYYSSGGLYGESTRGSWWGAEAYNGIVRRTLNYDGNSLYTTYDRRYDGRYIRCVPAL